MKSIWLFLICMAVALSCKKDKDLPSVSPSHQKTLKLQVLVKNLQIPWGMDFLPNGDFLFVERGGNINLMKKGATGYDLIMFRQVVVSEGGLLGLAVDPDFNSNHYVFIYETNTTTNNRVVRLVLNNDQLTEDAVILTNIPAAHNHDGGGLRFGPDGYLYLGTGDALVPNLSQDKNSLAGKIIRIDRDGNPAPGNPFGNHVWTYGHRNVQGFDWTPGGKMFSAEHGPSSEFGWCCHDEINLIEPGKNYGWPLALGGTESDSLTPPAYQTGMETIAPSGCSFIKGSEWGQWTGKLLVACLRGEKMARFTFDGNGTFVARNDSLVTYGRLRNVMQAPDGSIYFSTGNVGYATQQVGDDKIFRLYWE